MTVCNSVGRPWTFSQIGFNLQVIICNQQNAYWGSNLLNNSIFFTTHVGAISKGNGFIQLYSAGKTNFCTYKFSPTRVYTNQSMKVINLSIVYLGMSFGKFFWSSQFRTVKLLRIFIAIWAKNIKFKTTLNSPHVLWAP